MQHNIVLVHDSKNTSYIYMCVCVVEQNGSTLCSYVLHGHNFWFLVSEKNHIQGEQEIYTLTYRRNNNLTK